MSDLSTTKAVVAQGYGGPEQLALVDVPLAQPSGEQVRISVRAAGTNPVDYKEYSGAFGEDASKLPIRLGREAAGVVTAVGEAAHGPLGEIKVGDEVMVYPATGAYTQDLLAPAGSVIPKPGSLTFEQASGLMLTGTTAKHALVAAEVRAGDTIVVHGAAGGVGLMAIQLATEAGARVIGTGAASSHELLRDFGAEPVTYGEGLLERIRALTPDGVAAAIDTVGSDEALESSLALGVPRERIVTIAAFQRGAELGVKVIGGGPGADPGTEVRQAARLELAQLADAGRLRVLIASTYPLAEAADAHRLLAAGHTHGKVVLVP